jgi:hypothetical protein
MKNMNIKVISDGTPEGTHVIDTDTGKKIINCQEIVITINNKKSICNLLLSDIPFEYSGKPKLKITPKIDINKVIEILETSGKEYTIKWLHSQL